MLFTKRKIQKIRRKTNRSLRKLDASIVVSRNRRWDKRKKRGKVFAYILLIDDSSPFNSLITFTAHVCSKRSFVCSRETEREYNSESSRDTESCREWWNYVLFINLAPHCCLIFPPRFLPR